MKNIEDMKSMPLWIVWSNEHIAWWGPNQRGYYVDIKSAGRYDYKTALEICGLREPWSWSDDKWPEKNPPEIPVPSPEFWDTIASS